jgi:hypothetical protein
VLFTTQHDSSLWTKVTLMGLYRWFFLLSIVIIHAREGLHKPPWGIKISIFLNYSSLTCILTGSADVSFLNRSEKSHTVYHTA